MSDDTQSPALAGPDTAAAEFPCDACGGQMQFDAARGCLVCAFCAATRQVGADDVERSIVEYDLEGGLAQTAARGYGLAARRVACGQCGAVVSYSENETAGACGFCGSHQVVEQSESQRPIRPESVLPFSIDRAAARAMFLEWLGQLWFRPSNLRQLASVSEMTGMYVPYWTFDAAVSSEWTARAGYYYYVSETYTTRDNKGNSVQRQRQVQKVRWQPAWGSRKDEYDDLLVCGSKGLPVAMTQKLEPFDTRQLQAYDPRFLAGWRAEEYSVDLNQAWKTAVERIEASQRQRCSGDVPGDTQDQLHVSNRFAEQKFKHVLVPIWISAYRYTGKPYHFLINGQTGEVTGVAPFSALKIAGFCLLLALLGLVLFLLASRN
jgi:hypothetical protein